MSRLIWKLIELNKERVQSPSVPAWDAEASWTANGKSGRYRIKDERRITSTNGIGEPTGKYVLTRITASAKYSRGVLSAKGQAVARHIASVDEAKAIAERDDEIRSSR
jgi:hypothetical protein